jgi:hypothetical protein
MYTILQDHEGGLVLVIDLQPSAPNEPMFIYDGGDTALLFRDWDSTIRINKISEDARPILKNAENIFVVEIQGEDILRDYYAPIRIVKDVQKLIA